MILYFFRGGGTTTTTIIQSPKIIFLLSGRIALNVGSNIYMEL